MTQEELQHAREVRAANVRQAWASLSTNKDLAYVIQHDLKKAFQYLASSFQANDSFNPHAAALRDGNKEAINYITGRLAEGLAMLETGDIEPERKETISEFQGTTP